MNSPGKSHLLGLGLGGTWHGADGQRHFQSVGEALSVLTRKEKQRGRKVDVKYLSRIAQPRRAASARRYATDEEEQNCFFKVCAGMLWCGPNPF